MNGQYKIVYSGALKAGTDPEEFVQRFMQVFKVPEANARKLLSVGHAVTLKTRLEWEEAGKVREAMEKLGMEVHLEPMGGDAGGEAAAAAKSVTAGDVKSGGGTRCPKCGSERVEGDDCRACGIIISRFLEKQARMAAENGARGKDAPGSDGGAEQDAPARPVTTGPATRPAGNGWQWIAEAWIHFRGDPWQWIGALLVWSLLNWAVGIVPIAGFLAGIILGPIFAAGFLLGADHQREGGRFEVRHLFAGFSQQAKPLALVGVLYLLGMVAIAAVVAAVFGAALFTAGVTGGGATPDLQTLASTILVPALVLLLLLVPLLMAYWFAPALVVFDGFKPMDAMKASLVACVKNTVPFLIYGVIMMVLLVVAIIPFGLGLLVLGPVAVATVYTSYRDIFHAPLTE